MVCFRLTPRWLVWWLVLLLASPALAQERRFAAVSSERGQTLLEEAIALYDAFQWDEALARLERAIAADLNAEDRAVAFWHLALIAHANDDLDAAEQFLFEVLRANPTFELPQTARGTTFEPLFAAALSRVDRAAPEVGIVPVEDVKRGSPIRIAARVSDASSIARVELAFRLPDARQDTVVTMKKEADDRWAADIPGAATKDPGTLTFRILAEDEWQNETSQSATVVIPKGGGRTGILVVLGGLAALGAGVVALLAGGVVSGGDGDDGSEIEWPTAPSPLPPDQQQ